MAIPLLIVGGIMAAGTIGAAIIQANASKEAAEKQKEAAEKGMDLQRDIYGQQREDAQSVYNQQRADQAPWQQAGRTSLAQLMQMMGSQQKFDPSQLANDPGFQFRMAEGQKALERSASARGMLNSGAALKSLARFSQGLASDEYQNAWSRHQAQNSNQFNQWASLAGVGQTANAGAGAAGSQYGNAMQGAAQGYGNGMGGYLSAIGNANAAGAIGQGNAWAGGAQGIANAGGMVAMGYANGGYGGGYGSTIPVQTTGPYAGSYSGPYG